MRISVDVRCPDCQSENVIRHGYHPRGTQRFRCRACGRAFIRPEESRLPHQEAFKEQVLAAYQERSSMRGIARTFKISRNTLVKWLKEKGGACQA